LCIIFPEKLSGKNIRITGKTFAGTGYIFSIQFFVLDHEIIVDYVLNITFLAPT